MTISANTQAMLYQLCKAELPSLPNFSCFVCGEEIVDRPVFFERAWACHASGCIHKARRECRKTP